MLKENSDLLYLLLGVGVGAMTSFAKSIKNAKSFTKLGVVKMCAEALTCSLLTSGLSISLNEYYGLSYSYAICIGAFIGSMGSSVIIEFARGFITRLAGVKDNESK
jgi:hypothetical protein